MNSFNNKQTNNRNRNNRFNQRRRRNVSRPAPLELRAMAPRQVRGPADPPSTNLSVKATIRHMFEVAIPASGVLTAVAAPALTASMPGGSGWASFRILKVSVYAPFNNASIVAGNVNAYVALQMTGADGEDANTQTFIDHGMVGAYCPNVHAIPAFSQRAKWYAWSDTSTIFSVATTPVATVGSTVLCHVTTELQTNSQTPAFMQRYGLLSIEDEDAQSGTTQVPSKDAVAHSPLQNRPSSAITERIQQLNLR